MRIRVAAVALLLPALLALQDGPPDGCRGPERRGSDCASEEPAGGKPSAPPGQGQQTDDGAGDDGPTPPPSSRRPSDRDATEPGGGGSDDATPDAPGAAPAAGSGGPSTSPTGGTGTDVPPTPPTPRPPPAGIRFLTARIDPTGTFEVVVRENDVRGVDGGWTVVVESTGARVVAPAVTVTGRGGVARSYRPVEPGAPVTFVAVSGQRSPQRYAATYRAIGRLEPDTPRPTITITLIQ